MLFSLRSTLLLAGALATAAAVRSFAQSSNPGLGMVDNRFIVVNLTTADPERSNRNYRGKDYQLNAIIHYNTRLANSSGVASPAGSSDASAPALPAAGASAQGRPVKPPKTAQANIQDGNGNGAY